VTDAVTPAVRAARQRLLEMIELTAVQLIDIGVDRGEPVLRVHVRTGTDVAGVPAAVDGVRVLVVSGPGYAPERHSRD